MLTSPCWLFHSSISIWRMAKHMPILAEFWPIHGPCYLDTAALYQQSSDGYISGLGLIEKIIVSLSNLIPLVKPNIRLGGTPIFLSPFRFILRIRVQLYTFAIQNHLQCKIFESRPSLEMEILTDLSTQLLSITCPDDCSHPIFLVLVQNLPSILT